jgi:hypothetical protein
MGDRKSIGRYKGSGLPSFEDIIRAEVQVRPSELARTCSLSHCTLSTINTFKGL